jgi:hypothetical protein
MTAAATPPNRRRGSELLLQHCAALADRERPPAYWRLEQLVGGELARMLVIALVGPRGDRLAA